MYEELSAFIGLIVIELQTWLCEPPYTSSSGSQNPISTFGRPFQMQSCNGMVRKTFIAYSFGELRC